MSFPDYYKTLELDRTASPEQVWLSYHKLKFLAAHGYVAWQLYRMPELDKAYEILIHNHTRREYDWYYDRRHSRPLAKFSSAAVPFLSGLIAALLLYLAFRL